MLIAHLHIHFGKMSIQILLSIFNLCYLSLLLSCKGYIFWIVDPYQIFCFIYFYDMVSHVDPEKKFIY